jgi:hypothetical protein
MPLLSNEPIFTIHSPLGDIQMLGQTPYGERRVIDIHGGTVTGDRLNGTVLPGGADWQVIRADGVVHLQARYVLKSDTGGLITVEAEGYRHGPAEVMARLARDETVDPALYYFRTAMRFSTADPQAAWLNRILAIGRGARMNRAVRIEVFEVL